MIRWQPPRRRLVPAAFAAFAAFALAFLTVTALQGAARLFGA